MNNFHNYNATRIAQKSAKQRSAHKVNQFRASLKSNEPVDSAIYHHQQQRCLRIKTETQNCLAPKATSQKKRFSQLLNHVNERSLKLSIQVKQERQKKQPKFPPLKGFNQHSQIAEQSLDTPTFRNKNGFLSKTLDIENSSYLMDIQFKAVCIPTFNDSKEQSPNKEKKSLVFPKCIFFCDVKKARNFFQIPSQK